MAFLTEKICGNQEHSLAFASARPVRDILPLLPPKLARSQLIGGNGTMVYQNEQPVYLKTLPTDASATIIDYINKNNLDYMIDEAWNYSFYGTQLAELKKKVDVLGTARNLRLAEITAPVKILVANFRDEAEVRRDLAHLTIDTISYPEENCLDLLSKGVNKASALRHVFGDSDYVAFGNDLNDLEMLAAASYSVCVGDSVAVKAVADKSISTSSDELIDTLNDLLRNFG